MFLANLFLVSIVPGIQERYIAPTAPLVFIMLGYICMLAYDKIRNNRIAVMSLLFFAVLFTALTLYDISQLTRYTKEVGNRSILFPIYKDSLNKYTPPFMFGLAKRPSFSYPMDQSKKYPDFKVPPTSRLKDVMNYFSSNINMDKSISTMISYAELSPYVIYWHFRGWPKPVLSLNDSGGNPYFWLADYFIYVEASKDSPYYADLYETKWPNELEGLLLKRGYIKLVQKKDFTDLGLKAKIFRREGLIR
jgi:hypothetical protein